MVKTANEYYPDMSVKHVFLYAPTLLSAVLVMLKPFLSTRTQRKLVWAPPSGELLTLLQLMPLSAIPARHGGFAGLGPPAGQITEAEVPAGREVCVSLRTMAEGAQAHWMVSVADHSVALRVEFLPLGADNRGSAGNAGATAAPAIELLSSMTVVVGDATPGNCTGAIEGSHIATCAGHVRLTFDNGTSWVTAKHVFYATGVRAVPVVPPRVAAQAAQAQAQAEERDYPAASAAPPPMGSAV
jgi:hypothetical protein